MTDEPSSSDGSDKFPTEEELPDEPVTAADVDPFDVDDDDFESIDEFAAAEWKGETTADERIRAVIDRTTTPKSAGDIAATALVSETKARAALNKLAEEGIVSSQQTGSGKLYSRDPEWHLLKQIRQLAGSDTLVDHIQRIKRELAAYEAEYDAPDPEELLVSDRDLDQDELDDVSHWRTAKRELSHLRAAYRFREAKERAPTVIEAGDGPTGTQTTTPAGDRLPLE